MVNGLVGDGFVFLTTYFFVPTRGKHGLYQNSYSFVTFLFGFGFHRATTGLLWTNLIESRVTS